MKLFVPSKVEVLQKCITVELYFSPKKRYFKCSIYVNTVDLNRPYLRSLNVLSDKITLDFTFATYILIYVPFLFT